MKHIKRFLAAINATTEAKINADHDAHAMHWNHAFEIIDQFGAIDAWDVFRNNRKVQTLASYEKATAWVYAHSKGAVDPDSWVCNGGLYAPINGAPYLISATTYRP